MSGKGAHVTVAVLIVVIATLTKSQDINCNQPPPMVDPHTCCQDGGRDEVADVCAEKWGIKENTPPDMETAACLADCILKETSFSDGTKLNNQQIRLHLRGKFSNDTDYTDAMIASFERCGPAAAHKMEELRKMPFGETMLARNKCTPYAGLVLGCTYMEYFKNCPASKWTSSRECNMAKEYVKKCANPL
ncbi:Obp47b family protein [Megaselia abdita]